MCMMIKSDAFNDIRGFDESFSHSGEDIDICVRFIRKHLLNVYTPYAKAIYSDASYKGPNISEKDNIRCYDTCRDFLINGDPFYNPAYDYASLKPLIAASQYPAIELNKNFNNS